MSDLTATQLVARVRADTGDAKSDLQGVSAAMSGVGAAAVASSPQIDTLTEKIGFQERQLGIYNQQLAAATTKHGEGSVQVQKLQLTIDKLSASITSNEAQIVAEKQGLQSLAAALEQTETKAKGVDTGLTNVGTAAAGSTSKVTQLSQQITLQQRELGILQQQLQATNERYGEESVQSQKAQLAVDKLTQSINDNQAKLDEANEKGGRFHEIWVGIQRDLGGQVLGVLQSLGGELVSLGGTALDTYSNNEQLSNSLQSLVAKELQRNDSTKSMNQALAEASPKAQELLKWNQALAMSSPFGQEGIANAFRTVEALGFVSDSANKADITAKRLTQSLVDFATANGKTEEDINRIGVAIGQIQSKGKLAGDEVNQLAEAGVPIRDYLASAFHKSTEEIVKMQEKGQLLASEVIPALVQGMEKDFGGAANRSADSMTGLLNSMEDLQKNTLKEFFTSTFQTAQPYVKEFVDTLSSPEAQAQIRAMGDAIGKEVGQALPVLVDGLKQGAQYLPILIKDIKAGVQDVRDFATVISAAYQVTEPWISRVEALTSKVNDLSGGLTSILNPLNLLMGPAGSVLQLLTGQEDGLHAVAEGWRDQQAVIADSTKQQLDHNASLQTATTALDGYSKASDNAKTQAKAQADELTGLKAAQEQAIATLNEHQASYERMGVLSGYTQDSLQNERDAIGNRTQFLDRATTALKAHMDTSVADVEALRAARTAQTDHAQAVEISTEELDKLQKKLEQIGQQGTAAYDKLIQSAVTFQEKSQDAADGHQKKLTDIVTDGAQKLQSLDDTTRDKHTQQERSYQDKIVDLRQASQRKAQADATSHAEDLQKLATDHQGKLADIAKKAADDAQAFRDSQAEKAQTFRTAQAERSETFARQQAEKAQAFQIQEQQQRENHDQKLADLDSKRAEAAQSAQTALQSKLADLQSGFGDQTAQAAQQLQDKLRNAEESWSDQQIQSAAGLNDRLRDMDEALSDARQKAADAAVDRQEQLVSKLGALQSKADEQALESKSKYEEQTASRAGKHGDTIADLERKRDTTIGALEQKRTSAKTEAEAAAITQQIESQAALQRQQLTNENQRFADEQRRAAAAYAQQQQDAAKKLALQQESARKEKAEADQKAAEDLARLAQKAARERAEAQQDAAEKLQILKDRHERERQETVAAAAREDTQRAQQLQKDIQSQQQQAQQKQAQIQQEYVQAKGKEEAEYTRADQRRQQAYDRERQQQQAQFTRQQADAAADATKQAAAETQKFSQSKAKLDQSVADENASYGQRQTDAAGHYQKTLADAKTKLGEQLADAKANYGKQQDELARNYAKQRDQQAQALRDRADAENTAYQEAERKRAQEFAKQQRDLNQALGKSLIAYVDNQKSQGKLTGEEADKLTATLQQKYGVRQGVEDKAYQASTAALDAYIKSGKPNIQGLQKALDDTTQAAVNQQTVFDQKLKLSVDDVGQKFQDKTTKIQDFTQALRDAGSAASTALSLGQQLQNVAQSNDRAGERAGGTMPTQTATPTPTPAPVQAAPDNRPKTPDGRAYNPGRPASVPTGPYFQNGQNVSRETLVFGYNNGASYQDIAPGGTIAAGGDYKGYRRFGGTVDAGQRYLIGENGPEAFIPSQNGTVASNTQLQTLLNGGGTAQMQQAITRLTDTVRVLATTSPARGSGAARGGDTYIFQIGNVIGETPEALFERCRRYLIKVKQDTGKDPLGR